ncbi:MAG TPA: four helix bundle protein [Paludibacteraceae bacterium]|nr:four helix bundle protein [Paludibacteraceae bacterium]
MKEYNDIFRERTKKLALEIVREMVIVKFSDEVSVIRKQIIRSATSVAANYRAVCRARSERERFSKMCIVVEETDETAFWLELIEELGMLPNAKVEEFKSETEEILKVMSSYKKKLAKTLQITHHP